MKVAPERRGFDRRGARAAARQLAPGSLSSQRTSLGNEVNILAPPPQTHVRKKLEPWRSAGNDPVTVFKLNGSRVGELTVFLDRAAAA